jgi:hypothetical protein
MGESLFGYSKHDEAGGTCKEEAMIKETRYKSVILKIKILGGPRENSLKGLEKSNERNIISTIRRSLPRAEWRSQYIGIFSLCKNKRRSFGEA